VRPEGLGQFKKSTSSGLEPATLSPLYSLNSCFINPQMDLSAYEQIFSNTVTQAVPFCPFFLFAVLVSWILGN
jgi:hypothetical protein